LPRNFEEIYPVRENYKRFHQRDTAFGRAGQAGLTGYGDPAKRLAKIRLWIPGFTVVDYAFSGAALTVAQASNSGRGNMDSGFYS